MNRDDLLEALALTGCAALIYFGFALPFIWVLWW
jgi:hypothetical protein